MAIMITFTTKRKVGEDRLWSWVQEQEVIQIDDIKLVSIAGRDSIVRIIPYRVGHLYPCVDEDLKASFEEYMNREIGEE